MGTKDLLYPASFKGARFYAVGAITTEGGRKLVDHVYPNSERRFIEDMGKLQRDFTITGIVQGPNYYAKRNLLIKELESSGTGRLVHPFFGSIIVNARPFTLVEDLTQVNIGTFTMSFGVPSKNIYPTAKNFLNFGSWVDDIKSAIDNFLTLDFDLNFADTILAAENLMNDVFDKFNDVSRKFQQVTENITALKAVITDAQNNIASLIRSPALVNEFFDDMFDAINNLYDDPKEAAKLLIDLFGFSGGDNSKQDITVIRTEEKRINDAINITVNTLALSNAYLNASLAEFDNDQELLDYSEKFEAQFESIIDTLDETIASDLYSLREQFRRYKDQLLISLDKVVTVSTEKMPVSVLAYQYYGSTDKYDDLIGLNSIINPSEISGDVKILTQ